MELERWLLPSFRSSLEPSALLCIQVLSYMSELQEYPDGIDKRESGKQGNANPTDKPEPVTVTIEPFRKMTIPTKQSTIDSIVAGIGLKKRRIALLIDP